MSDQTIAEEFFSSIDLHWSRFSRPRRFIFLCGGIIDGPPKRIRSVRDYIFRQLDKYNRLFDREIILAETINEAFGDYSYPDLISLESDIANLAECIVLVAESPGSIAELGAFSQVRPIAEQMIVIVRGALHPKKSFISVGPLRFMERNHPNSVHAFDWSTEFAEGAEFPIESSLEYCGPDILSAISSKVDAVPKSRLFDPESSESAILLCLSIVAMTFGPTLGEIHQYAKLCGAELKTSVLQKYLFCLQLLGWLAKKKYGNQFFYFPTSLDIPAEFSYSISAQQRDTIRWRRDIRAEVQEKAPARFRLFQSVVSEHSK